MLFFPLSRLAMRIAAASIVFVAIPMAAHAVTPTPTPTSTPLNCDSGVTFNTTTTLSNDYVKTVANSTPCLTLSGNGLTLNLNGHTITRTDSDYTNPTTAIACTATGSQVVGLGTVRGGFTYGVTNCEVVDSLLFSKYVGTDAINAGPGVAVQNDLLVVRADSIVNNVITTGNSGIESAMLASTSTISDNYIEASNGISITGTFSGSGPLIENNILRNFNTGISKNPNTFARVRKNLLIEFQNGFLGYCIGIYGQATISGNYCECASNCEHFPPYSFPWY